VSAASGRLRTTELHYFNGACACQAHCRAREENLAACAAEVLLKLNMTIGKAAIYCTLVAGDTDMDSLR
jgi:hypothetical protein